MTFTARELFSEFVLAGVTRPWLSALLADLNWPTTECCGRLRVGAGDWQRFVDDSTPSRRLDTVCALSTALVKASEFGRLRLDLYAETRTAILPHRPDGRRCLADRVVHVGDQGFEPLIVATLQRLPAPVREHAVRSIAFLSVGDDSAAWTASAHFLDREGQRRERIVVLGPSVSAGLIAHEVAHAWHDAPVTPVPGSCAMTVRGEAGFREYAGQVGLPIDEMTARMERRAWASSIAWLGTSTAWHEGTLTAISPTANPRP